MPLDRAGISQHFVLLFLTWDFSLVGGEPETTEAGHPI